MNIANITPELAKKLICAQFPQYAHLPVRSVKQQGHDNRTYRLGDELLIRMPTTEAYAFKVPKEQEILPKLAKHLSTSIPTPIKMGVPSPEYPYPFSIYRWLSGTSANLLSFDDAARESLARQLAQFLTELHGITIDGPPPGQHNWWRGAHVSVYDEGARNQIAQLSEIIDAARATQLWNQACQTQWNKAPVWIHGDFVASNILITDGNLSGVIDFGGTGVGDPACDLAIAWTFLTEQSRPIFQKILALDQDTWLRARAWVLWKATFELCRIHDKHAPQAPMWKKIIEEVLG